MKNVYNISSKIIFSLLLISFNSYCMFKQVVTSAKKTVSLKSKNSLPIFKLKQIQNNNLKIQASVTKALYSKKSSINKNKKRKSKSFPTAKTIQTAVPLNYIPELNVTQNQGNCSEDMSKKSVKVQGDSTTTDNNKLPGYLVTLPSAEVIRKNLQDMGCGDFVEITEIDKKLGGEQRPVLEVVLAVDLFLCDYAEYVAYINNWPSDAILVLMFKPEIIKCILKDYPEQIVELEKLGIFKYSSYTYAQNIDWLD